MSKYCRRLEAILLLNRLRYFDRLQQQFRVSIVDFSNCQKVINYANIVLGTNASQYLRDWAALGALSPNKNIQPNAYVDADNRANLLVISAASYWPLVSDPGYANCERYCMNNITASESCKSEGPWGDQSSYHQIPFAPGGSIKNGFRRLVIYQQFTSGCSFVVTF